MLSRLKRKPADATPLIRYRCPSCRKKHDGFPALAYMLPDDIAALGPTEREQSTLISTDLCILGNRHFIRCVLRLPVTGCEMPLDYGPWVEVAAQDFARYAMNFYDGIDPGWREITGSIANTLAGQSDDTMGVTCTLRLNDCESQRPWVKVADSCPIGREQEGGISVTRAIEIASCLKGFVMLVD